MGDRDTWFIVLELSTVVNLYFFTSIFSILAGTFSFVLSMFPFLSGSTNLTAILIRGFTPLFFATYAVSQDTTQIARSGREAWVPNRSLWATGTFLVPFLTGPVYIVISHLKTDTYPGVTGGLISALLSGTDSGESTQASTTVTNSSPSTQSANSSTTDTQPMQSRGSASQTGQSNDGTSDTEVFSSSEQNTSQTEIYDPDDTDN